MGLLEEFRVAIEGKRAPSTVQRYISLAKMFLKFVDENPELGGIPFKKRQVEAFLTHLKRRGSCGTHRRWVFYALKAFYRAMDWTWPLDKDDLPKLSEPHMPYFNEEETFRFLGVVEKCGSLRDQALMFVATSVHATRIQYRDMNRSDYDWETKRLHVSPREKGDLPGNPELPETAYEKVEAYLSLRKDKDPCLFRSNMGGRLSLVQLNRIFRKYLKLAGFPLNMGHGFHSIRRGLATIYYKKGLRELEIQKIGRWRTPTMPGRYIQLVDEEMEEKRKRKHPLFTRK